MSNYGHFNVIKGQYPSHAMTTAEAPVSKVTNKPVVRGSAVIKSGANFVIATDELNEASFTGIVYWALQGEDNAEAVVAGGASGPKINAISGEMALEIETDQFSGTINNGDKLTVTDGKVVAAVATDTVIGIASSDVYERWLNDCPLEDGSATAALGYRQGTMKEVVRFSTVSAKNVVPAA